MDDNAIYNTLLEIKGSTEVTNALLTAHVDAFNRHVEDDAQLNTRIASLEASQQRQAGFISAVGAIGTAIGGVIVYILGYFFKGHAGG